MNLRKTEVAVMSWLAEHPGTWYKGSHGPIERLLKRGLIEKLPNDPCRYQLTELGKLELQGWKGVL